MADIEMRLEGFPDLDRAFKRLPLNVRARAVPKALRAGAILARRAIRNATPVGPTGNLKQSTTFRIRKYRTTAVAIVGHRWEIAPHAHLIEEGTPPRERETIGGIFASADPSSDTRSKSTGKVEATHFMRDAFDQSRRRIVEAYKDVLLREVDKL